MGLSPGGDLAAVLTSRKISGIVTAMTESTDVTSNSRTTGPRNRRRYGQTRRAVPGLTCCRVASSSWNRHQTPGLSIMGPLSPGPRITRQAIFTPLNLRRTPNLPASTTQRAG